MAYISKITLNINGLHIDKLTTMSLTSKYFSPFRMDLYNH